MSRQQTQFPIWNPLIPVNKLFELFLATFAEIVDPFAPERKAIRKEK